MFARWSSPGKYAERMDQAAGRADFFVLNGDIFDFRWSILPGVEATLDAAIDWLAAFAAAHHNCTVYYILGNHDGFATLADRVAKLAEEMDNFEWRPAYLRMGDILLTHGDLFWREGRNPFQRRLPDSAIRITRAIGWLYHFIHTIQATRLVHALWPARRCARRIAESLAAAPQELAAGINEVYCGHTHIAVSDFACGDITYHNTGSGIRGLSCNMLEIVTPDGCEVSP